VLLGALGFAVAGWCSEDKKPPPKPPLPDPAALSAKAAIIIDEISGKVLWSKNPEAPRFPASTTKIMTAMLMIERCLPSDVVTAPADIEKVGEASLHLKPQEQLSVRELLWGILLRSANDGSVAAAVHCSGSVEAFSAEMNERAKQIGCSGTNFTNPNGLKDPLHVTTARDLALMAREAMRYPEFREIVRQRKHTIVRSINQADTLLISKNKFLRIDPTADGIKTGFTRPAGQCFVGSASRGGTRFITVVLGSEDWLGDTAKLTNYGFNAYEVRRASKAGEPISERLALTSGSIAVGPVRAVRYVARKGDSVSPTIEPRFATVRGSIRRGDQVGVLHVSDGTGWTDEVPLVALESTGLPKASASSKAPLYVLGACLAGAWAYSRKQRRRMYARFSR
jgi:D-alanyl-D-alanine carboxypeptidase